MLIWYEPNGAGLHATGGIVRAKEMGTIADSEALLARTRERCEALQAEAEEQARATVEQAQREAEELLAQAQQEAEATRQQAADEARAETEQAFAQGEQRAAAEWHERHASLLAAQLAGVKDLQDRLATVVAAAVQRIVETGPREDLFRRSLITLQELMQRSGAVALRVNSADAEHARAAIASLPPSSELLVEVKPDDALAPGACIFESEIGMLDTSLEVQLSGLRGALDRAVQQAIGELTPAPIEAGSELSADDMPAEAQGEEEGDFNDAADD